jgi:hypothetical protein
LGRGRRGVPTDVTRLRQFVVQHLTAVIVVAAAAAAAGAWTVLNGHVGGTASPQPATVVPTVTRAQTSAGAGPTRGAVLRAAGHLTGVTIPALPGTPPSTSAGAPASAGAAPTTAAAATTTQPPAAPPPSGTPSPAGAAQPSTTAPPAGGGRTDPFSPLAFPGTGTTTAPPALPPVPPLSPSGLGPVGSLPPGGPAPDLFGPSAPWQLTGIVYGPTAVAILTNADHTYIVEPGDLVASGVRIVAIDAQNQSVTLGSHGQSWQLRLGGGKAR